MVSINQIERGAAKYIDTEILPKMNQTGLAKIVVGTAAGVIVQRLGRLLGSYVDNPALHALGIVDNEKNIDIDLLLPEIKKNIPDEGVKFEIPNPMTGSPLVSMRFHRADADQLYQSIVQ